MLTLEGLLQRCDGRPIPRCPGRYVLRAVEATSGPAAVVGGEGTVTLHDVPTARDQVVVTRLGEDPAWGLISYARSDGTWLHTANTPAGLARKLDDLGISTRPARRPAPGVRRP